MSAIQANKPQQLPAKYSYRLARNEDDLRRSQKLRYRVFAEELGAELPSSVLGLDIDHYDAYCDHLLVWDEETGELAASTRLLNDKQAAAAGGFYSSGEFEMSAILGLDGPRLEIGRTCVHPDYRSGAAMGTLWQGVGKQINRHGYRYIIGCASIDAIDGMAMIHAISERLLTKSGAPEHLKVVPRHTVPQAPATDNVSALRLPPLLKAYASMGAKICGAPCWDAEFNCADVFVLVDVEQISPRFKKHFFAS